MGEDLFPLYAVHGFENVPVETARFAVARRKFDNDVWTNDGFLYETKEQAQYALKLSKSLLRDWYEFKIIQENEQ